MPLAQSDHFFGTTAGERRDPDASAIGILTRAVARVGSSRAESGLALLPPITLQSLRRTWASFCAMIGRDLKGVAAQIGPTFTFSAYQRSPPAGDIHEEVACRARLGLN